MILEVSKAGAKVTLKGKVHEIVVVLVVTACVGVVASVVLHTML